MKSQVASVYVTVIKCKLALSNANCQYSLICWLLIHLNTIKIRYKVLSFFLFTTSAMLGTVTSSAGRLLTSFVALRSNAA